MRPVVAGGERVVGGQGRRTGIRARERDGPAVPGDRYAFKASFATTVTVNGVPTVTLAGAVTVKCSAVLTVTNALAALVAVHEENTAVTL